MMNGYIMNGNIMNGNEIVEMAIIVTQSYKKVFILFKTKMFILVKEFFKKIYDTHIYFYRIF